MRRQATPHDEHGDAQLLVRELSAARSEHGADLEQANVPVHSGEVELRTPSERVENLLSKVRLGLGKGVCQANEPLPADDERHRPRLVKAGSDERFANALRRDPLWIV